MPWSIKASRPCASLIASDDPHSKCVKCMGFSHAREAVYGASKCKFCENLHLKTLRSGLEVFEWELSVFPRRAPEASAAFRESATWGSDVELEAMESEQTGLAFSLRLSLEHVRASLPVEFAHNYLYPCPEARNTISFGARGSVGAIRMYTPYAYIFQAVCVLRLLRINICIYPWYTYLFYCFASP